MDAKTACRNKLYELRLHRNSKYQLNHKVSNIVMKSPENKVKLEELHEADEATDTSVAPDIYHVPSKTLSKLKKKHGIVSEIDYVNSLNYTETHEPGTQEWNHHRNIVAVYNAQNKTPEIELDL